MDAGFHFGRRGFSSVVLSALNTRRECAERTLQCSY